MDLAMELIETTKNPGQLIKYENAIGSMIEQYGNFLFEYKDELEEETVTEAEFTFIKQQEQLMLLGMRNALQGYLKEKKQ